MLLLIFPSTMGWWLDLNIPCISLFLSSSLLFLLLFVFTDLRRRKKGPQWASWWVHIHLRTHTTRRVAQIPWKGPNQQQTDLVFIQSLTLLIPLCHSAPLLSNNQQNSENTLADIFLHSNAHWNWSWFWVNHTCCPALTGAPDVYYIWSSKVFPHKGLRGH